MFNLVGAFNEEMKFGAEDAEFSYRLLKKGIKIKYVPQAYAFHEARSDLKSFIHWQLRRGKANYHFARAVGKVGGFVKLQTKTLACLHIALLIVKMVFIIRMGHARRILQNQLVTLASTILLNANQSNAMIQILIRKFQIRVRLQIMLLLDQNLCKFLN